MMLRKTILRTYALEARRDASMRPQHDAAENPLEWIQVDRRSRASMRPQHDAAENASISFRGLIRVCGFNEAAA